MMSGRNENFKALENVTFSSLTYQLYSPVEDDEWPQANSASNKWSASKLQLDKHIRISSTIADEEKQRLQVFIKPVHDNILPANFSEIASRMIWDMQASVDTLDRVGK